jgi:hypothetical protein
MFPSGYIPLVSLILSAGLIPAQSVTPLPIDAVPTDTPLYIRTTAAAHLHIGSNVIGVLIEPVYLRDHMVLPQNAILRGVVRAYASVDRKIRATALLNGDATPLKRC